MNCSCMFLNIVHKSHKHPLVMTFRYGVRVGIFTFFLPVPLLIYRFFLVRSGGYCLLYHTGGVVYCIAYNLYCLGSKWKLAVKIANFFNLFVNPTVNHSVRKFR